MPDTPPARRADDNGPRYGDAVTTPHVDAARTAMKGIETTKAALAAHIDARDTAIAKMHTIDGMSAPEIARALGLSKSLVHRVIRTARRVEAELAKRA